MESEKLRHTLNFRYNFFFVSYNEHVIRQKISSFSVYSLNNEFTRKRCQRLKQHTHSNTFDIERTEDLDKKFDFENMITYATHTHTANERAREREDQRILRVACHPDTIE